MSCMEMCCFVFTSHLAKTTSNNITSLCIFLCFRWFQLLQSFNILVSEGHESFTCQIFGYSFWCIAQGHRKLLVVISFFLNEPSEQISVTTKSMGKPLSKVERKKARDVAKADWPPCIRQLRPRYERQSKPWCPVGVLRNARCTGFSFPVTVQNATTENSSILQFVSKSKSL